MAVQRKVEPSVENLDVLMELVEEIADHVRSHVGLLRRFILFAYDPTRNRIGGHYYRACVSILVGEAKSFVHPRVKCVLPISAGGVRVDRGQLAQLHRARPVRHLHQGHLVTSCGTRRRTS